MAVNDPNYRYATQTWEANGIRTEYEINFDGGFIRQSDVVAFSVLVDPITGLVSDRTVHTLTFLTDAGFLPEDPTHRPATVQITPAIPTGRRVIIFRSTEKAFPLVDYQNGSILNERTLDLANKQAIFSVAEIMDGLNAAAIDITNQVQEVIDLQQTIDQVYQQVVELLEAGGIVSVEPLYWSGAGGDGVADYPIPGATVENAAFYDTYVGGNGMIPEVEYTIVLGEDPADSIIRFSSALPENITWLCVLRGYAKPYTGDAPVTTLRIPVITTNANAYFIDKDSEFALIEATSNAGCLFTVKPIPLVGPAADRMGTGSFLSIRQGAVGQCVVEPEDGSVTIKCPTGYLPRTRALGSVISLVCKAGDDNTWMLSGDLAVDPEVIATGGPVITVAAVSGNISIDCAKASTFRTILSGDVMLIPTNVAPTGYVSQFELWIIQNVAGGHDVNLPLEFKKTSDSQSGINVDPDRTSILRGRTIDGGDTWAYSIQILDA